MFFILEKTKLASKIIRQLSGCFEPDCRVERWFRVLKHVDWEPCERPERILIERCDWRRKSWLVPVENVDLHPDSNLKRDALLWHEGEVGRVLLLVGVEVGVRVELVEQGRVGQVEVGEGDVGRGVVLASAHVEQAVGQVHVQLRADRMEHWWAVCTIVLVWTIDLRK